MDTVLPSLFLQVILIASNAFFAMSEFAVVSVNTQKMKRLAEGGSKPAARLLVITEAPSDFLATIQVGVTLSGFLASAAAAVADESPQLAHEAQSAPCTSPCRPCSQPSWPSWE